MCCSEKLASSRRVRNASYKLVEFVWIVDIWYALLISGAVTLALALLASPGIWGCLLVFCSLLASFFLLFWLALINCNPYRPGYTRFDQLASINKALPSQPLTRRSDPSDLVYPLIFKPSLCSTNSSNIALIHDEREARAYLDNSLEEVICAQKFHPGEEFTIMWERWPWQERGRVTRIHWRKKTHPPGEFHPLSGSKTPKVIVNANELRTPELMREVEQMVAGMHNVYCTRFDVRADSHDALSRGDFWVLESNGTIGSAGRGFLFAVCTHWPRRIITGLYNMLWHQDASVHPRILRQRLVRFCHCGGWDFRICDAY